MNLDKELLKGLAIMEEAEAAYEKELEKKSEQWDDSEDPVVTAEDEQQFMSSGDLNTMDSCSVKTYYQKIERSPFQPDMGFHYSSSAKRLITSALHIMRDKEVIPSAEEVWMRREADDKPTNLDLWEDMSEMEENGAILDEKTVTKNKLRLEGILSCFLADVAPNIKPFYVEKRVHLPLPGGEKYNLHLHEYVDLIDRNGDLYLFKFPAKSPSKVKDIDHVEYVVNGVHLQNLITYAALASNFKVGANGRKAHIMYFVGNKVPKIITQDVTITQKQIDTMVQKSTVQWEILVQELYTPNRSSTFCKPGPGGCSYYHDCHSRF